MIFFYLTVQDKYDYQKNKNFLYSFKQNVMCFMFKILFNFTMSYFNLDLNFSFII